MAALCVNGLKRLLGFGVIDSRPLNSFNLFMPNIIKRISTLSSVALVSLIVASLLANCTKSGPKVDDGTLRLALGPADAKTLDPSLVEDVYSATITSMIYEGLLEYHYLKRPHELVPLLAEELPRVSKDGLTYTFKIRKGVRFMDHASFPEGKGRELKAVDFVYSFLRVADPKLDGGGFWIFDGHVVGINDWREKQKSAEKSDYAAKVEGFQALDDYTLQIKLKSKYPQLLFVLAMPISFVVPREVVEAVGKDFVNTPVGTGPYKLTNWLRNSKLSFEKNPNFRGQMYPSEGEASDQQLGRLADAGKPLPFADKVEYHVFVEDSTQWLTFKSGGLDESAIPKDNYKEAIDEKTKELASEFSAKGIRLQKVAEPDVTYIAFNMEDPVIKKGGANLRKAISLAVDKERNIDLFSNGRAILAHSPVPPGLAGYDESFVSPFTSHDIEKAKEYLAKAGFPEGKGLPELVFESTQGTTSRQRAEKFQSDLEKIGIKVKTNINQFAELTEKTNKKRAQIWGIAWLADYPDAENFLQLLYGPNKSPGPNGSNFDNKEYNRLFEKMRGMMDSPERRKIITQMKNVFVEELPWITESHRIAYRLERPWLKNYKHGYMGSSFAKFLRVDTQERANAKP